MRTPSSTPPGRAWLKNFLPGDRDVARRLLDGLRFVAGTEFRATMIDILRDQVTTLLRHGTVALHPVRNDQTYRAHPFAGEKGLIESGSALIALNIASEVSDAFGKNVLLAPNLASLRDGRVRNVILVDDFIGSGRSVIECVKRWRSNPTVRSWTSYHLIEFHLAAYSYTSVGYAALESSGLLDMNNVRTHRGSCDIESAKWTDEEREQVLEVCHRYADKGHYALGVGGGGALIVFDHTVPNNLPRILLQDSGRKGADWSPFFPPGDRRLDPAQATQLMWYRPAGELLVTTGSPERVEAEQQLIDRHLRLLLYAIADRPHFIRDLQRRTGFTDFQVRHLLERARERGFVTAGDALTEAGLTWAAAVAPTPVDDEREPAYYYPTQLRGADDV